MNGASPTYYNLHNNATSVIDLGLCSSQVLMDFGWEVSKNLHGSDHFPIFLSLHEPRRVPMIPRWNIDKAKWSVYRDECSQVAGLDSMEDHIEAYNALEDLITAAATKAIPLTKPSKGRPPVPWWNKTCKSLRRIALRCYDKYRANPTYTNKIIYQRALAKKK